MNISIFNKLILHTVKLYIEKALQNKCYQRDALVYLNCRLSGYCHFHRFTRKEAMAMQRLGYSPYMKRLGEIEVDYAIYAIFLMVYWVDIVPKKDRPSLNISDAKIKKIHADIVKDMLSLKVRDKDDYYRVKFVIDDSRITAKNYVNFIKEWKDE